MTKEEQNIAQLVDKFFEGNTSLAEENELYSYFKRNKVCAELQPLQSLFAAFQDVQHNKQLNETIVRKPRLQLVKRLGVRACAAIFVGMVVVVTGLLLTNHEQNYCKAYVNDQYVSDTTFIMNDIANTMSDIACHQPDDVSMQLRNIFMTNQQTITE